MTDIKKDFGESFNLLVHRKKIIVPMFFAVLIPMLLLMLFLSMSGITPLLKELGTMNAAFEQQKKDYLLNPQNMNQSNYSGELLNYLAKDSEDSKYNADFMTYIESQGYDWDRYKELINMQNIVLLIVFLMLGFIISFYLTCMSYAIIALNIKMDDVSFGNIIRVTNSFLLKFLSAKIVILFMMLAPIMICGAIAVSLFFLNKILGILSIVIFILLILVYILIAGLRLIFVTPSMYLDKSGPVDSVKHSLKMTKGHLNQVLVIFLILYGLTLFLNSFISQPLSETYRSLLFNTQGFRIVLNSILLFVFLIAESFVFSLENVFLFNSYIDFSQLEEVIKKR
jgi:hypothetical protein